MNKYYYKKKHPRNIKKIVKYFSLGVTLTSSVVFLYLFYPFFVWKLYLEPAYAQEQVTLPIPKKDMVDADNDTENSLLSIIENPDTTNVREWFPESVTQKSIDVPYYALSIPTLKIKDAVVATGDTDLTNHLVQYGTHVLPPDNGTTVIFGHSTLPQFFKQQDYKTIFSKLYTLKKHDTILLTVKSKSYTYTIKKIRVVKPSDLSMFEQLPDTSHLILVTCTPPGTTWKRLVIESELTDGK
jgi:sortase A